LADRLNCFACIPVKQIPDNTWDPKAIFGAPVKRDNNPEADESFAMKLGNLGKKQIFKA